MHDLLRKLAWSIIATLLGCLGLWPIVRQLPEKPKTPTPINLLKHLAEKK